MSTQEVRSSLRPKSLRAKKVKEPVAKKPVVKKPVVKRKDVIGAGSQKLPAKKGGRKAKVPQHFAVAELAPHLHEDAWQAC
jgi:hypothetical protein